MQPNPSRPARRGRPNMTICIGFSCADGLFFASDSQMSLGSKYKQWDEPKITTVRFAGGPYAVFAISGSLDGARCFEEIFEKLASETQVADGRTIANTAESALKQTRSKILSYVNDQSTTTDERVAHLASLDFEALLGYFHGPLAVPYIFKLALNNGIAVRSRHPFEAIGCGSDVAGYILTGGEFQTLDRLESTALGVYVVEACKKFDQACGGPIQHVFLPRDGQAPSTVKAKAVRVFEDAVRDVGEGIHDTITDMILKRVIAYYKKEEKRSK